MAVLSGMLEHVLSPKNGPTHGEPGPPSHTCFLGPTQVHNPNSNSIDSATFAPLTEVSSGMPEHALSPKNCSFAYGNEDSYRIHGSLSPP